MNEMSATIPSLSVCVSMRQKPYLHHVRVFHALITGSLVSKAVI